MPLLTELNHIFLGVSINMTLLTELGVLKHYGLGNVTPERPCAKRVAAGGKVPPRPLPHGRGSDGRTGNATGRMPALPGTEWTIGVENEDFSHHFMRRKRLFSSQKSRFSS